MASILLEFEVLPEDVASEPTARDVAEDLQRQLADKLSSLRQGEFARYAAKASLTGQGLPDPPPPWDESEEEVELPGARTPAPHPPAAVALRAPRGPMPLEVPDDAPERPAAAQRGGGAWRQAQAFSNAELIDRISSLERLLASAEEKRAAEVASAARPAEEGVDTEKLRALEQQCHKLQSRLDDVQREARAVRESSNAFRDQSEQLESRLRERESVLSHAKDMWVKETARAQKLEDALVSVEEKLLDHEGQLNRAARKFDQAQQEVRQLSHLTGMPIGRRPEMLDPSSKGVPTGSFAGPAPGSRAPRPFDASFGGSTADPRLSNGGELKEAGALPQIAGTNAERLRRLCIVNDAVLYEDEVLQIGVKAQYAGEEGQVDVFFGNKSRETLQAFAVHYHMPEERALRVRAEQVGPQLGAGQQALQRVSVSLAGPFAEMPWLRVQFKLPDGGPRRVQTRLPVVYTKFMVGYELSSREFFHVWRSQGFADSEVATTSRLAPRLYADGSDPTQVARQIARIATLGGALRLLPGIDPNPHNLVLAARPADAPGLPPSEDAERDLALARIEVGSGGHAGKVRVAVRSGGQAAARAVGSALLFQLAESPDARQAPVARDDAAR